MSKQPKEKPSYNVWQNTRYIVGTLLKTDKKLALYMCVFIISSVTASVAELFLPKTVVQMVENQIPLKALALTILAFTAVIALTRGMIVLTNNLQIMKKSTSVSVTLFS